MRLSGAGGFAALALGLLSALGGAAEIQGQTATRPEVLSLQFEGNEAFSDRALAGAILTRETRCRGTVFLPFCWMGREFALDRGFLNPRWFVDDHVRLHIFYYRGGYRRAQVDTVLHRPTDTSVEITFQVREGTPHRVTALEFRGLDELEGEESLTWDLPIGEGDPLDMLVLEAARDTLTRRLQNRGYAHAEVLRNLDIPADVFEAAVEFDVYTGPRARFGPIRVVGNEKVADAVVLRMLPFREGSLYSRELLFEGQRNIFGLEIFRHATVRPDSAAMAQVPDSVIPLLVEVNEGSTHRVRTGAGWNTAECFTGQSRWSSRNFFGGARRFVVRGRVSNVLTPDLEDSLCSGAGTGVYGQLNWVASADFTQPFLLSPRNALSASLFVERQSLQDVFVRRAVGLNLGVTRTLGRATSLTLSYRPQLARLDAAEVFFCTSFLVCDPLDIDLLQSSNWLSPVGLSLSRDRTDRTLDPTGGYRVLLDLEHASSFTGSDFQYERLVGEAVLFQALPGDVVLAGRLRGGWMWPRAFGEFAGQEDVDVRIAHPQKRFYAGGSNSVRGYAQNQLGPRVVSVQVEELVFPTGDRDEPVCTPEAVAALTCDASPLAERRFLARPTGGGAMMEGNLELRFPVLDPNLQGAAFLDFGQVWPSAGDLSVGELRFTPGLGVRYHTPVGPVRVDLAYRPPRVQALPVVSSLLRPFDPEMGDREGDRIRGPDGAVLDWVALDDLALLGPRVPFDERNGFLRQLQLHFSIGHAF